MFQNTNSIQKREEYKNKAVRLRESGKAAEALEMFKEIISWDESNNNVSGQIDATGHLRITYTHLGDNTKNKREKQNYRKIAMETAEQALELCKINKDVSEQTKAISTVHSASARYDYSEFVTGNAKKELLKRALRDVKGAMSNFPGSRAHLAWPALQKAKILSRLDKNNEAVRTLTEAENYLYEGYDDELKNGDQGIIKLNVWLSGLHLALATICANDKKYILAKHYANSVLTLDDPEHMLGERKKQAQKILDEIK